MKRTRIINLIALFVNLAIFAAFFAGFYFEFIQPCIPDYKKFNEIGTKILAQIKYFEFIAAFITMLASFLMMFSNGKSIRRMRDSTPRWKFTLRYISMGMSSLIIFTILLGCIVNKTSFADFTKQYLNFQSLTFYWYIAMPLASIFLFLFLELEPKCRFRKNFGPLIAWIAYCTTILVFMFIKIPQKGISYVAGEFCPYFIFLLTKDLIGAQTAYQVSQVTTISLFVVFLVLSFVLPMFLRLINRVLSSLIIGYEYVEIDDDGNVVRPINKGEEYAYYKQDYKKKNHKAEKVKHVVYDNVYRIYVNDRKLRNWKVVLPNKTIKVFPTQQEALAFASNGARKSRGTVRVHTALGKLKYEAQ